MGLAALLAGAAALALGLSLGWLAFDLVGVGLLVLAGFVLFELRQASPMLSPRIFPRRGLSAGSISIFVQFFAFFGFIFLVLQYLQLVRGDSPLVAALSLIPMALTLMPSSRGAAHLAARVGNRRVCVAGLLLLTGALVVLAQVDGNGSYWLLLCGLLPLGAGMGWP